MAKLISIANQKGGVGKTTTSINLAVSFAVSEVKTLLIDLDPQSNATTGLSELVNLSKRNIYDVIISGRIKDSISKTKIDHLDVIASTNELVGAEVELVNINDREKQLQEALKPLQSEYDYILIDCPPALGLLTINALVASNSVIVPLQSEFFALEGISSLINSIELIKESFNPVLTIEGILLTMVDKRNSLSALVEKDVREHFGETVYKTTIPRNVKVSEAPSHGKPAILYDVNSAGSMAYIGLAREILNKTIINE